MFNVNDAKSLVRPKTLEEIMEVVRVTAALRHTCVSIALDGSPSGLLLENLTDLGFQHEVFYTGFSEKVAQYYLHIYW